MGERGLALALARNAYETASALSSVWTDAARVTLNDLELGRPMARRLRDMDGLVTFDDVSSPSPSRGASIEVRIDRARFTLTVLRGGVPMRAFAVGVGENGATPSGRFGIANKLTDPGWYNRGNVVPAGDPTNPIGHRWMGLGGDEGATSIGIHPSAESVSIGAGVSQGCIRMWPEDAESLFRLCLVGTRVTVE
jgi:lipoprotein-anchoring transpeptidase ErfK/SrfK